MGCQGRPHFLVQPSQVSAGEYEARPLFRGASINHIAEQLTQGHQTISRPSGQLVTLLIRHRGQVTLHPVQADESLEIIVLVRLKGRWLLHRIKAVRKERYLIVNARDHKNGCISWTQVKGVKL
jgi:hypothetical protein